MGKSERRSEEDGAPPLLVARGDRARVDEVDRILEGEVETLNFRPGRPGPLGA